MKKLYALLAFALAGTGAHAQLTGTKNIPGDYASLQAAIGALNTQGVGAGGVTLNLVAGNAETAPAGGYVIGGAGSLVLTTASAANPVTIQGNGNTITASAAQVAGVTTDAVFKLIGADYVTLKGFTIQENAANTVNTPAASNTMTEWGIALLMASTTDGAQNNTIQGNTISLNRSYLNTFAIISSARFSATAPATAAEATSAAGSNSNNKVYGNTISNTNFAIAFLGSSSNHDQGNDIGGSSAATGNTITNAGNAAALSTYNSLTGNNYICFMNHQQNNNFSYNNVTSALLTGAVTYGAYLQNYSVTAPAAGSVTTTTINNNTVTVTTAPATGTGGTAIGLNNQGIGTLVSTATVNMNNNTVQNCSVGGTAATAAGITAVVNLSAAGTINMNNNLVLNNAITATAGTSGTLAGVNNSGAGGTLNMIGNAVRGFATSNTSGQTQGVINQGAVTTAINIQNNQLGNASTPFVTVSAASSGGIFAIASTSGTATTATSITGNDIRGIVHTATASATINLIQNAIATLSQTISNNTFTNLSLNTTGSVNFIQNDVSQSANGSVTVSNNSIVTAFTKTAAGGTVYFYYNNASAPTTVTETHTGNNFSNVTVTGATTIGGWFNQNGSGTSPFGSTKTITNNTFTNITGGTNGITVMTVGYSNDAGTNNVSGNTISTVTGGGAIVGISSPAGTQNILGNTISGLTGSGTGAVSGIVISGGSKQNVYGNKVFNLENSNAGGAVNGLSVSGGTTVTAYNNIIGDLRTTAAAGVSPLTGINVTGGTNVNAYFNTVYLNGTSAGANFGSSAISASTTPTVDLRNNIFINTSTAAGTGLTVAYRRSSTTLTSYSNSSNNNLFYAGTPSATNLIFSDGTNSDQTLAAYQARVTPRDASSATANIVPLFISTTGSNADFLHITAGSTTVLESGGVNIAGITTDFDGNTRAGNAGYSGSGNAPDIGADEFAGVAVTPSCVAPTTQATGLVFGAVTNNSQAGGFTAAGGTVSGYLVVRSIGALNGTPANGTSYSPGNAVGTNGIVVAQGTGVSFSAGSLASNTNYTYTVFTYNTGACLGGPVFNTTNPLSGDAITCAGLPTGLNTSALLSNGFTAGWTAPTGGSAGTLTYTVEVATDNAFTNIVATQNTTSVSQAITGLTASTTYYIRVRANNGTCASPNTAVITATTACQAPTLTGTTPATRCGVGPLTLGAAAGAGVILNWYAAATGGNSLFTGSSYTTPSISSTTTYYVEPSQLGSPVIIGPTSETTANLGSLNGYGMYFNSTGASVINSVDIYPSTTGTLRVSLLNGAGTEVDFRTFTIAAGDISNTVTKTLALGFNIPAGATGWQLYYDIAIYRGTGSYTYPYSANGFSITGNTLDGNNITAGTRYYFWSWNVTTYCTGTRTAVTATVTTPPAITVSATPGTVCAGVPAALNATSSNAAYTYVWTPGNLSGAAQSVTPAATTKYIVTATDAGTSCVARDSVTVTVSATPDPLTINAGATSLCPNDVVALTAVGGTITDRPILTETFDGAAPGWSITDFSTGGTPALGIWQTAADGVVFNGLDFHSNDNSQFMISNADAQGFGGMTLSYLNAPAVNTTGYTSLALSFYHYYRWYTFAAFDSASVEVSTNGTTWTAVQTWKTAIVGASDAFENAVINLNAYINQPTLYIRFKYHSDYGYYWAIDNVQLLGSIPTTITWSPTTDLYTNLAATTPYTGGPATIVFTKPSTTRTYTATVSSPNGCSRTATTTITVGTGVSITTQPVATQAVCAGQSATFTVAATGSGTLTYQWKKNNVNIGGATSATLTLSNVTAADAATYTVTVTGGCGNVTSANAVLTVNAATAITTQPTATQAICANSSTTLTVVATGTGTLTYQWKKDGTNIPSATSASYTISNATAADAATYTVVVTGDCGSVTSANAVVTINAGPAITMQSTGGAACVGSTFGVGVIATGNNLTYQWRKNGVNIPGANASAIMFTPFTAGDAGSYDVVVTGDCGSVTSNPAVFTVGIKPVASFTASTPACVNSPVTFTSTSTSPGNPITDYRWSEPFNSSFGNAATATRTFTTAGSNQVQLAVNASGIGCADSVIQTINVLSGANITAQPNAVTTCVNTSATFSVTATGAGTITYQWRKDGVDIPSATSATYTINNVTAANAGTYTVIVSNGCSPVTSGGALLTVDPCTAVSNIDPTLSEISVRPSLAQDHTTIVVRSARSTRLQWQLVDAKGRVVRTFNQTVVPGVNQLRLALQDLAAGSYLLNGFSDKGKAAVLRIVKM